MGRNPIPAALLVTLFFAVATLPVLAQPQPPAPVPATSENLSNALASYQSGKFDAAAAEYRRVLAIDSKNPDAYAGMVRTLLKQRDVEQARATIDKALQNADGPVVRVALGEVEFREGAVSTAEREWVNVINAGHPDPRAYLGISEMSTALCLHRRARTMIERAYAADPNDADVRKAWISTLPRSQRVKFLEAYLAQNNADDEDTRGHLQRYLEYLKARLQGPKGSCHLVGNTTSTETKMLNLLTDSTHLRGFGLEVTIGERKSRLLLDTGAGGIVVSRGVAQKAGLARMSETTIRGLGDKGDSNGFIALAPSIKVGGLEFQNCPVEVMDRRTVADEEGLIGADVFEDFLVDLDFAHGKLRLSELPHRPDQPKQELALSSEKEDDDPGEVGSTDKSEPDAAHKSPNHGPFDRYVAPEMKDYTTVLRFGHMLLMPTFVENEKQARFFLIDSGAFSTHLSLNAAKSVTKVHNESEWHLKGLNGEISKVYNADKATLTFGHLRQPTEGILVLNLKGLSDDVGTELSGIIGFATLRFLDVKIDYRDGLVWMDYQGPKWLTR